MITGNEDVWLIGAGAVLFAVFLLARFNARKLAALGDGWETALTSGQASLLIGGLSLLLLVRGNISLSAFLMATLIISLIFFVWWLHDRRRRD
jgi:hypothetical protein